MAGEGWTIKSFAQCAQLIRDTVDPKEVSELPYIGLEHIAEDQLKLIGHGWASQVTSVKSRYKMGDILFGKLRPYFRKLVIAPFDGVCSTDIWVIRPKLGIDYRYLFYWMASNDFIEVSIRSSEGTRMPRAQWDYVERIIKPIPPLKEQQAIAHILGTLDDKIELNRRMNTTLEQIAQAIFKSWFVDFDPVRAKMEGRPTGLPKEIEDLFPDGFEDSELGEIPRGWEIISLYETASFINGAAFKSNVFCTEGEGLPIVKIAELKYGITSQTKWSKRLAKPDQLIDNGDLLYSWSGSPDTSLDAFLWTQNVGLLNQHIFKVVTETDAQKPFVYYLLKFLKPNLIEIARNKQTTGLGHVTVADMKRFKVCYPPKKLLNGFNFFIGSFFDKGFTCQIQNNTLKILRDLLLIELVSGKLRIGDPIEKNYNEQL